MRQFQDGQKVTRPDDTATTEVVFSQFKIRSIIDLMDNFYSYTWRMKALIEMVGSSDLERFSNSTDYQFGLQDLFELILGQYEETMKAFGYSALNSPEFIIESAKEISRKIGEDSHNPCPNSKINESLEHLDTIISLFDTDQYPEAPLIRDMIMSKTLKGKKVRRETNTPPATGTDG